MFLFDLLYASIYRIYSNTSEQSPEFASSSTLSAFQAMNIFSIMIIFEKLSGQFYLFNKTNVVIVYAILSVVNFIKYILKNKYSYDNIKSRLNHKTSSQIYKLKLMQIVYSVCTLILFIYLLYLGK